jgi:solute carrier family 26 (sodium-independent sulfate anion transporter), member 11
MDSSKPFVGDVKVAPYPDSKASEQSYQYEPPLVTTKEWIHDNITGNFFGKIKRYLISLFPIFSWIYRYNLTWAIGGRYLEVRILLNLDLIAGLTVGAVLVPQSMSYAKIATLPVQYGLYSSFVGVLIYCFFATSKDVTIGPVAVMSLQTAHVIASVQAAHPNEWSAPFIATTLAFFCGIITLGIGILRLGFVVEFIPVPAIAGFMTGSAIAIALGQVPSLLGTSSLFNTRAACYLVIIDTLKYLPQTKIDAAFGFPALFFLYAYRYGFNWASRRYPKYKRWFFYALVLRNAILVVFITIISYLVCRSNPKNPPISILKTVPSGFQNVGRLTIDNSLASSMAGQLPVSTVVLLLEHIAISKAFGRVNDYKIVPDQELIAIGVTNVFGTFFNAYPATGSFSRSAIKSMSGVRTPLADLVTGIVVVLALYALTGAFYWIPNAGLAAGLSNFYLNFANFSYYPCCRRFDCVAKASLSVLENCSSRTSHLPCICHHYHFHHSRRRNLHFSRSIPPRPFIPNRSTQWRIPRSHSSTSYQHRKSQFQSTPVSRYLYSSSSQEFESRHLR